jgi:hypothetical protein
MEGSLMLTLVFALIAGTPPVAFEGPIAPVIVERTVERIPVATPVRFKAKVKVKETAPTSWTRTDTRGVVWTHSNQVYLDQYVDYIETTYLAPATVYYSAPVYGTVYGTCVGGSCAPASRRGLFGRIR